MTSFQTWQKTAGAPLVLSIGVAESFCHHFFLMSDAHGHQDSKTQDAGEQDQPVGRSENEEAQAEDGNCRAHRVAYVAIGSVSDQCMFFAKV